MESRVSLILDPDQTMPSAQYYVGIDENGKFYVKFGRPDDIFYLRDDEYLNDFLLSIGYFLSQNSETNANFLYNDGNLYLKDLNGTEYLFNADDEMMTPESGEFASSMVYDIKYFDPVPRKKKSELSKGNYIEDVVSTFDKNGVERFYVIKDGKKKRIAKKDLYKYLMIGPIPRNRNQWFGPIHPGYWM